MMHCIAQDNLLTITERTCYIPAGQAYSWKI